MEKQKTQKTSASDVAPKQPSKETPEQMIRSLQGIFCKGRIVTLMTIEQTVTIPADRRIIVEVPPEIPAGKVILTFTPAAVDNSLDFESECPICAAHRDPITGEERFNAETIAAIREGRDMMKY